MKNIIYSESEGIAILSFSRISAMNALNKETFAELNKCLDLLQSDSKQIKALIVTGEGRSFIAGADISEMKDMTSEEATIFAQIGQNTLLRLEQLPMPVIGAINGFALGGGLEMALACDFLIASETAKFSAPEINWGLIPGFGGTLRLPRAIGINRARYYMLTGAMFTAGEALQMGLVQKVVPPLDLIQEAMNLAKNIAAQSLDATKALKSTLYETDNNRQNEALTTETRHFARLFDGEAKEGMLAFLEKRKPKFQ